MGLHTIRVPENLEKYVELLIAETNAGSFTNAINLTLLERMASDKKRGKIAPFEYRIDDGRKKSEIKLDRIPMNAHKIELSEPPQEDLPQEPPSTDNAPLRDALHTRGPDPDRSAEINTTSEASPFSGLKKPPYPGTRAEYEEALRKGKIINGMFEPPEA